MQDSPRGTSPAATGAERGTRYAERLYVTWYWWPLPLLAALILAAEVHATLPPVLAWLPYAVLLSLTVALLIRAGRSRILVVDGDLRVGDARLPLRHVTGVEIVGANEKRRVLGPQLDPAAFVLHRGWIGPVLRVRHTDPSEPTPYWLFSSRHPERLAEILRTRP